MNMMKDKIICYFFFLLIWSLTDATTEELKIKSTEKDNLNCQDNICLPKCCQLDEVFSFSVFQCLKLKNPDISWIPKLTSRNLAETTTQQLSKDKKNVTVKMNRNGNSESREVVLFQQWPDCENYGPVTEAGVVYTDGQYYSNDSSGFVPLGQYCMDVSVDLGELPHDFSIANSKSKLMVLTCFEVFQTTPVDTAKEFLLMIGLIISCVSLITLLVTMLVLRRFKQLPDLIQLCHASSLLVADFVLLIVRNNSLYPSDEMCLFLAISMHYAFLAVFFWLNVMCYDIMRSVQSKSSIVTSQKKRFLWYSLYAWGSAFLIVGVSVVIHFIPDHLMPGSTVKPHYAHNSCWIRGDTLPMLLYFYGVVGLLLLVDLIFVLATVWYLRQAGISFSCELVCCRPCNGKKLNSHVDMFWHRFLIFATMILCWMTEFISWLVPAVAGWLLTDFLNSLQGFFLLLIFLLHPNNRKQVLQLLKLKAPSDDPGLEKSRSNDYTDVYSLQT